MDVVAPAGTAVVASSLRRVQAGVAEGQAATAAALGMAAPPLAEAATVATEVLAEAAAAAMAASAAMAARAEAPSGTHHMSCSWRTRCRWTPSWRTTCRTTSCRRPRSRAAGSGGAASLTWRAKAFAEENGAD